MNCANVYRTYEDWPVIHAPQPHLALNLVAASDNIALIKSSIHHSVLTPQLAKLLPIEGTRNLQIKSYDALSRNERVITIHIRT